MTANDHHQCLSTPTRKPRELIGEETIESFGSLPDGGNAVKKKNEQFMLRAFVLNTNKEPLMPCSMQRAYELLCKKKAAIYRQQPFTIILKTQSHEPVLQPVELRIDPGSKSTGLALVVDDSVVFAANLTHRSNVIRKKIQQRAAYRRRRRSQNLRYRSARFDNRTRRDGWLPPSLQSRVDNVVSWTKILLQRIPLTGIAIETVRFDMQKLQNPEISGVEYRQGELLGYEIRGYLLEKFHRTCAYCDATGVPLQVEHIVPRSKGGSNRISNLTLSCEPCNTAKDILPIEQFLAHDRPRLAKIKKQLKTPLKDAAAVNATRYAIGNTLKRLGLPITFWSGGRTKMNRIAQGYAKDHWIDAACVGESGAHVRIEPCTQARVINATGRGTRRVRRTDAYGFPRGAAKTAKRRNGYSTGDTVVVTIKKGKAPGRHQGRISATNASRFDIATTHGIIGTTHRTMRLTQRNFGYHVA